MATVYLVSCVSKKRTHPTSARGLYISDWFRKAQELAERRSDQWFILSAEYGLVSPGQVIQPYEKTLNRMCKTERIDWSKRVLSQLRKHISPGDAIVLLAGVRYREHIVPELLRRGYRVEVPMEGLRIGQQLRWLKNAIAGV